MTRRLLPVRGLTTLVMLVVALVGASYAFGAEGDPDTTFGGAGVVLLDPPQQAARFQSAPFGHPVAAPAGDGKVVVAQAWINPEIAYLGVSRLNPDGSLDSTWKPDPTQDETGTGAYRAFRIRSVEAVRVIGGVTYVVTSWSDFEQNSYFALYRMLADGQPDPALVGVDQFEDGAVSLGTLSVQGQKCATLSADITSTGRIHTFWDCGPEAGRHKVFNADGTEDKTAQVEIIGGGADTALVDAAANDAGDVRVLTRGTVADVPHFWLFDGLTVINDGPGGFDALDIDADGGVALAGDALSSTAGWAVRRFDADGEPADGFGTDGETIVSDPRLAGGNGAVQHVTLGGDGQVVAIGQPTTGFGYAILRVTSAGAPNTGFGTNGVKVIEGPENFLAYAAGPALLLPGNRLIVPSAVDGLSSRKARVANTADVPYVAVHRLGGAPAQNPQQQQNQQQQTQIQQQAPAPPTQTSVPSTAPRTALTCLSRRSFTIRLRPKRLKLESATVTVAGKTAKVRRIKGRLTASVDLRKLRQATFTVKITAKDARGRTYREQRAYRTCRFGKNGPKVKGGSTVITLGG